MAYDIFSVLDEPSPEVPLVNQSKGYDIFSVLKPDYTPPVPKPPESWFGEFGSAFGRGFHELEQMGYGLGALGSSWMGAAGPREFFMNGYNAQTQLVQQNPATVQSIGDIDSFDKAIRYGLAATGEFMPMVAQGLVTGAIGAAVGSAAEPGGGTIAGGLTGLVASKAVKSLLSDEVKSMVGDSVVGELNEYLAGKVAKNALSEQAQGLITKQGLATAKQLGTDAFVGLSNIGIMQGALYGDLANNDDIPESDKRIAASVGGLLAAIPMTGVAHLIASKFMPGVTGEYLASQAGKQETAEEAGYLARFMTTGGKEMMKNFGEMGAAMFTQTAINIAAKNWADPSTRWNFLQFSPAQWQEMLDATVKGGIGGAMIGGPISAIGKMTQYPDPAVREGMRDVLQGANDAAIPMPEVSPVHREHEAVVGEIGRLEASINSGTLSDDDLQAAHSELAAHEDRSNELLQQLGLKNPNVPKEPLVNQNPEPKVTPDTQKVESLKEEFTEPLPKKETPYEPPIGVKVSDKQAEIDAHIDSIAGGTEYGEKLKQNFGPHVAQMMAAEDVTLKTDPDRKTVWAATMDDSGGIQLHVPNAEFANQEATAMAQSGGTVEAAHSSYLENVDAAVSHEVAHVADLINLRNQWKAGSPDSKLSDFVNQKWRERGERMRAAEPLLPEKARLAYNFGKPGNPLTDIQLGQELPRMAVEMARRGQTSEVTEALAAASRNNNVLTAHFRDWIDALKSVAQTIKNWLSPENSNPELRKAYDDINATLDKYGVLVNQKPEAVTEPPAIVKPELVAQAPPEPILSVPATQPIEKPQTKYSQFRQAIREKGPSDVARSYLDWKHAKDEMPVSNAEIETARLDLAKRAPDINMNRERFRSLVKEHNAQEAKSTKPAQKTSISDVEPEHPTGYEPDLSPESRGEDGYHSNIVAQLAEKSQKEAPGFRLSTIRSSIAQDHPYLSGHLENIIQEIQKTPDTQASERWAQAQPPIRGELLAENIKGYKYAMFIQSEVREASRQLGEARGIKVFGVNEEVPADHYIIDTSTIMHGDDMTVDDASVHEPVTITNKLQEAQATKGIPETHPVYAFGHEDLTPEAIAAFDEHFGENKWILKNFSDDAKQSRGVAFAEAIKQELHDDPESVVNADASVLMVQQLHDIGDAGDRSRNVKIQSGKELRVHVLTDMDGNAHVLPFSTFWKLTNEEAKITPASRLTPIMVESPEILEAHAKALEAVHSLPLSDRSGQFFGLDIMRTQGEEPWGVVENNPTDHNDMSGAFLDSALAHDSYMAALMGERPIHAELADLVHQSIQEDSLPKPLVNQTEPANKPTFSNQVEAKLQNILKETNEQFDREFSDEKLGSTRSRFRERGAVGEYENMTPQVMEYKTQPKTEGLIKAQEVISHYGLENVANSLLDEPLGMKFDLNSADELRGAPGAGLNALYRTVAQQLDSSIGRLSMEGGRYRPARTYLEKLFSQLETLNRTIITPAARAISATHEVDKVWNSANARRSLVEPLVGHLEKVLGKKGAGFIRNLTDALNGLMSDYADRVVTRPEMVAQLQKVADAAHTRAFQQEARKTYVMTDKRARGVVQKMAARMAEYVGMDRLGSEWANEAATRAVKQMNDLPVSDKTKTEVEIFQSAVHQVARDNAQELGLIGEHVKKEPTIDDKFAAILKNPGLYNEFTQALRRQMMDEYKPEPGTPFHAKVEEFHNYMAERAWSQGMVDSLVNKNLREYETTFAKIAREHYGISDFREEAFKEEVRKAMADRGVDNPGLLDQLVNDAGDAMRSRIEQGRLDFFGSDAGVRQFLKHMQTTLAAKAKEHAMVTSDVHERLADWLSEDFGIPDTKEMPLATQLQEVMTRQYNSMLGQERENIVRRMMESATAESSDKVKRQGLQSIDKTLQLINLGVFRNEDAYNALAPKFGLPPIRADVAAEAERLGQLIATAPNERIRDENKQILTNLIASQRGVRPMDMFYAGLYTNMLSGPSTAGVHISSNMTSVLGHLAVTALQNPRNIPSMIRSLFRTATTSGQMEMRESFWSGLRLYRTGDKFFYGDNPLEMRNPVFKSSIDLGSEKLNDQARAASESMARLSHTIYSGLKAKYVGRYLNAADAFFYKLAQEASFSAKTGITETEEMRRSAMDQARQQMAQMGWSPDDSREMGRKQQIMANQIINEMRLVNQRGELDENLRTAWVESHNEAMDATFKQDPKGLLGYFSKLLETWSRGRDGVDNPIGKMMIPFTRIAANVTNQMLEWTPYGLVRWGAGHLYGEDFRLQDEAGNKLGRDPKVALRALMGTAGIMALYGLFAQHHDDKDPWLAVYDDGSKNPERRRQMMDMGWRPKTIKVGGGYYSYVTTPYAMAFSILGRMFDNARDGHPDENGLASSAVAMLQTVTHESFLSSLTDFMSAVDSPNPETKISRMMARMATTPFIPNLVQQVDKWVDPSIQQAQGFTENVMRNLPMVRHSLMPSLNVFGEQIKHDPAIDLPGTERFLTMEKLDDPVYNFISESNTVVPGFSKGAKLGNQVMTREQYYQYVQQAGPEMKKAIQAELPQLRQMDREHAQERINEITRKVKEGVRDKMRGF